jgi:hypothetical protein
MPDRPLHDLIQELRKDPHWYDRPKRMTWQQRAAVHDRRQRLLRGSEAAREPRPCPTTEPPQPGFREAGRARQAARQVTAMRHPQGEAAPIGIQRVIDVGIPATEA